MMYGKRARPKVSPAFSFPHIDIRMGGGGYDVRMNEQKVEKGGSKDLAWLMLVIFSLIAASRALDFELSHPLVVPSGLSFMGHSTVFIVLSLVLALIFYSVPRKLFSKSKVSLFDYNTIVVACIFLVLLSLAQSQPSYKQQYRGSSLNQTHSERIVSEDVYRSDQYGFEIKFPKNWEVHTDTRYPGIEAFSPDTTTSIRIASVDFSHEDISSIKDLGPVSFVSRMIAATIEEEGSSNVRIINYGERKVNDAPAYWTEVSFYGGTLLAYSIYEKNKFYQIVGSVTQGGRYEDIKKDFVDVFSTFRVL